MDSFVMCEIPAGEYPLGDNSKGVTRPGHTVELAAFAIGETVVTNAQYVPFVEAKGYADESLWTEMGWRWLEGKANTLPAFWSDAQFNAPDQPIVGIGWYEALAFTRWLTRETGVAWRLPSEAEWEAAARGEDDPPRPRIYNTSERGLGRTWAVTTETNVAWCGARDLCGNVWEWCSSRWGKNWQVVDYRYPYFAHDGREHLDGSQARIMRGGSWFDPLTESSPSNRGRYLPGSRGSNIGFRLARNS